MVIVVPACAVITLIDCHCLVPCICSWYATFCAIAGVDATDHRAALAGLPPVDSISLLPVLLSIGGGNDGELPPRRRLSLALGSEPTDGHKNGTTVAGWIAEEESGAIFKLLLGSWDQSTWVGPHFPNASTNFEPYDYVDNCTIPGVKTGCLL
eukprot:COSAG02_NODE_20969_length_808_cov_0.705219_1_plen_153_part_00